MGEVEVPHLNEMSKRTLCFLALLACACCCRAHLGAQEVEGVPGAEPSPPAQQEVEAAPSTECRGGYTAVSCTAENTKFRGLFDIVCLLGIPAAFLVAWPLARVRSARKSWRMTGHLYRWIIPAAIGAGLMGLTVFLVPFFPQMSPVTPEDGLLRYAGVDPSFIENCDPCRTRVTNQRPMFGLLPGLMPAQGLAPQYPHILALEIVLALVFWAAVYWAAYFLRRRRHGLARETGGGA